MKQLNLKLSTYGFLFLLLVGCSAKVETPQAVPVDNSPQSENVGPFEMTFDANNSFAHTLKINIKQDEGFIEYKINPSARVDLVVEETSSAVTGCDATTVKHDTIWFPDEANKSYGQVLKANSKFFTSRKTTGLLMQSFKGLQNCTSIEIKTRLKKEIKSTKVGSICEGFTSPDQCKLSSYCKEKYVGTPYYEVEVWNQQGSLTAKKFMVRSDGTRGLMSMYTVTLADAILEASFNSTVNNQFSLKINNTTYDGRSTETINGQNYTLSLACEI